MYGIVREIQRRRIVRKESRAFMENFPMLKADAIPRLPAINNREIERAVNIGRTMYQMNPLAKWP